MSMRETDSRIRAQAVAALNRIADALDRLADVYLYVNLPQEEPSFEGQSLSDSRPGSSLPSDFNGMR
jgi:hypothetical protein